MVIWNRNGTLSDDFHHIIEALHFPSILPPKVVDTLIQKFRLHP